MTHAQIQPPKLSAQQQDAFARLLAVLDSPAEQAHGIGIDTLATMLRISRPEAVALAQELHRTEAAKYEGDRIKIHPKTVAARFSGQAPFVNPFVDGPTTDFGAAAAEIARSPMIGGMLAGLPRAERMGCIGILDVVLAQGDKGVPKSTFARAIPEEKVAELLSSLQYAGAIRMQDDRVYPGYNLEQTIRLVSNIKGA